MSEETALTTVDDSHALAGYSQFSIAHVVGQTKAIREVMQAVMKKDEHYGVIPGTNKDKPTLLQPGAEKLIMLFWLKAEFITVERIVRDDFIMYEVKCSLKHRRSGEEWGEGIGACNSKEKRYQSQTNEKVCPKCSKPAIIKGKKDYGGGWLCWNKKGGCNAKFADDDKEIVEQDGQTKKDSVYDLQNTIFKMACKRAKVSAVLTATAASDVFTQDLEDLSDAQAQYIPPSPKEEPRPKGSTSTQTKTTGGNDGPKGHGLLINPPGVTPPSLSVVGAVPSESAVPSTEPLERVPGSDDGETDDPNDTVECFKLVESGHKKNNTYQCHFEPIGRHPRLKPVQLAVLQDWRTKLGLSDADWLGGIKRYYSKDAVEDLSTFEADDMDGKLQARWNQRKYKHPDDKKAAQERRAAPENMPPEMRQGLEETS